MHSLFAIEPEAVNNWADLRYTVEKFGYSNGLLIARYPKRWYALVMEACRRNELGEIELKRIEEKLSQVKNDRIFKFSQPYDKSVDWLNNVTSDEICSKLDAILTKANHDNNKVYPVDDVDESLFQNRRDVPVKRTANGLADAAKYVICDSNQFILVDPYFQSKSRCLKVLQSFLDVCHDIGKKRCDIVIHIAYSKYQVTADQFKEECANTLKPFFDGESTVQVVRWSDDYLDFDFHARYLISDKGGLRIDRGFNEPEDRDDREKTTDIVCMDDQRKKQIIEQFSCYEENDKVIDCFQIL